MLKGFDDIKLTRFRHVSDLYVFFIQRWYEILETKTLDMYQYNILNSYIACDELSNVIEKTISGLLTSRQNIDDCKDEAFDLVKEDFVLEKHNRHLQTTLFRILNTKIDGKSKSDVGEEKNNSFYTSLTRLKYQLKNPLRILKANLLEYILLELKVAIDEENNFKIDKCIGMLVSQCIHLGWSPAGLLDLAKVFEEPEKSADEKWNLFSSKLKSLSKDAFKIFYSIRLETSEGISAAHIRETIDSMGLEMKDGRDIINEQMDNTNLCSMLSSESTYVLTNLQATDYRSATLQAINILNNRLSIATFYNVIDPWIASSPQIVAYNETKGQAHSVKLTDIFKTYDYVDSNNSVFCDTNAIFSDETKIDISNKLNSVFTYTNLSRSSIFQETKFITLWIALESVMRTGQYSDIITHIKNVLPEILSIRYIYRIVRNFTEDCMRCNFKKCEELSLDFSTDDKKLLVKTTIAVFRDPSKYNILLSKCNKNKLLTYRCEEIHQLLNDKDLIKKKFLHYSTKIRWHIQRLYRIRNEITHSAFNEKQSLIIYIEHLYTYLSQLMSEVVFYVMHKNCESVEEAYATIPDNYKTFIDFITNGNPPILEILPNGVIDFN